MAFVTCSQFKTSQEEQDKKAISAEDSLLDKSSGEGGGKVTIEKIKEAIAGDVEVAVKDKSGITGKGKKDDPLKLDLGEGLAVNDKGQVTLDPTEAAKIIGSEQGGKSLLQTLKDNDLLGDGLDVVNGKLIVKTIRFMDASGTVLLGYGVDKE
ncbi:hypothetical protein D3M79_04140 [Rodentibacter pneumotropicus]|nr:hypothetical protein [Rodentibacter pneumotropicus]THA00484.1 hypothetical protein D3M79_04140 [Rodentibacter pneumotropicus]THA00735.1 hypothetical protein D3M74_07130 [Rodentibacter pneumotropicus]THA06992.1 hypothetical protein D3M77_07015 [Rodentibacter pneumotropicus]